MNHSGNQAWNPTFPFILAWGTNEHIFWLCFAPSNPQGVHVTSSTTVTWSGVLLAQVIPDYILG